jgi:hypothetical protein
VCLLGLRESWEEQGGVLGIIEYRVVLVTIFIVFTKVWVFWVCLLVRTSVVSAACLRAGLVVVFNGLI